MEILVAWKDVSKTIIHLKYMRESNPIDNADFDKDKGIYDEPTFSWWVACTLKKWDVMIYTQSSRE